MYNYNVLIWRFYSLSCCKYGTILVEWNPYFSLIGTQQIIAHESDVKMPRSRKHYDYVSFAPVLQKHSVLWDPRHPEYRLLQPTCASYKVIENTLDITGVFTKLIMINYWNVQINVFSTAYFLINLSNILWCCFKHNPLFFSWNCTPNTQICPHKLQAWICEFYERGKAW